MVVDVKNSRVHMLHSLHVMDFYFSGFIVEHLLALIVFDKNSH